MDLISLNPTGLLARLFGQDGPRPLPPQSVPTGRSGMPGGAGDATQTWNWYRSQVELSHERLELYRDYLEMDQDDLVASVLDAVAEDASQIDFMNQRTLWVESDNPLIEQTCNATLDRLKAEENVASIIRETAKFGDDFEFLHYEKGRGVIGHEYYPPDMVWRYEVNGELWGFTSNEQTGAPRAEDLTLPWQFQHFFRLGGRRSPGARYGDSWLRPSRRLYRKLQMAEDAMVMYRIRRAPDRDVYYIDVGTETPPAEQAAVVKMWKRLFKKNIAYDPAQGKFRSDYNPMGFDEDIFFPTNAAKTSRIERLQGSTNVGEIFDIEFLVNRLFSTLRAPKDYFGFGESGAFDRGKSLEQQDIRWSRGIKSVQLGATQGYARILQIDMALRGTDPLLAQNQFVVKMAYPSALDELQRADLYDARLRSMEGLTRVVNDVQGLDKKKWYKFLLQKFAGFPKAFIDQFVEEAKKDTADGNNPQGTWGLEGDDLTSAEEELLSDSFSPSMRRKLRNTVLNGTHSSDVVDGLLPR